MKNCTPLWREAHFEVKMYRTHQVRTTFGSWDVEKVHAVVARSTFPSQCAKHLSFGAFLEVAMSKKCTSLWREAHFQVKMCKTPQLRSTFDSWDVEKVHAPLWREAHFQVKMCKTPQLRNNFGSWDVEKVHAVVARSTFGSQNVKNTRGSDHFWKFRCRKSARRCGAKHISKSMLKTPGVRTTFGGSDVASRGRRKGLCTLSKLSKTWKFCSIFNYNHHYTTLHSNTLHHNYNYNYTFTTFYYTTLHYTTLHSITPNYSTLHCITLHSTKLHYITLHYTTFHYTTLH